MMVPPGVTHPVQALTSACAVAMVPKQAAVNASVVYMLKSFMPFPFKRLDLEFPTSRTKYTLPALRCNRTVEIDVHNYALGDVTNDRK